MDEVNKLRKQVTQFHYLNHNFKHGTKEGDEGHVTLRPTVEACQRSRKQRRKRRKKEAEDE